MSADEIRRALMAKAVNEQMDRLEQENGGPTSRSSYGGEYLPQGRNAEINEKVIMPAIMNVFKTPEDYILKSEDFLQNRFKPDLNAPEVVDPKQPIRNIQDELWPRVRS